MKTLVITSGYFSPLAAHHLDYLYAASELGYRHICVVNNDLQVQLKGSIPFQSCTDRIKIIDALECVHIAWRSQDADLTICETLRTIWELNRNNYKIIFANGGNVEDCTERELCEKMGVKLVFGVGGQEKTGASSQLIEYAAMKWVKKNQKKALSLIINEKAN